MEGDSGDDAGRLRVGELPKGERGRFAKGGIERSLNAIVDIGVVLRGGRGHGVGRHRVGGDAGLGVVFHRLRERA